MKLKLSEIRNISERLELIEEKRMPVAIGYVISKNKKILSSERETIAKSAGEIISKYCKKDESGTPVLNGDYYTFDDEKQAKLANDEITELYNTEIEVPIQTISLDVLKKCDETGYDALSLKDMEAPMFMILE